MTEASEHSDRLSVTVGNRNPWDIAREVADHIVKHNEPAVLFAMGNVTVQLRDDGSLRALDAERGAGWLAYVSERVDFRVEGSPPRLVSPPMPVMKMLPEIVREELPPLDGIVTAPYLDRDGVIVATDGYHPGSRLVLRMRGLDLPPVSDKPSADEVAEALALLCEDWLGDFPFDTRADRACAIAELLTVLGRQFFPLAPMFVNDASSAGSGKGLLTTTLSLITTGEPPHFMELPAEGEEQRKTITAALLEGRSVIAWDELHIIAGKSLAAVMTAENYSARLLGSTKMISVRNRFTQIALGNNVEVRGDMKRRVMPCRIVPHEERPELRSGFRHPDLPAWVRANRGRLLWAGLTLYRNWSARGRRSGKLTMGSFEHWARIIGGVLQAAGISDFGANTADWLSYSEQDDGWASHLHQLRQRFGPDRFTVADVADAIEAGHLKRPPIRRDENRELVDQIGYAYRGLRETPKSGLCLARSRTKNSPTGGYTWTVRQVGEPAADGAASADTWSVWSVSSVSAGQTASEPLTMATDDESMVSNPSEPWSVMVSDGQDDGQSFGAGQSGFTDHTDHTDHRSDPVKNDERQTEGTRAREARKTAQERTEEDWESLIAAGSSSRPDRPARQQPKHQSRAQRLGR